MKYELHFDSIMTSTSTNVWQYWEQLYLHIENMVLFTSAHIQYAKMTHHTTISLTRYNTTSYWINLWFGHLDIGNQVHKNSQIYVRHILTTEGLAQSDQELGRNLVIQDGILWAIYSNQMSINTLKKIKDMVYTVWCVQANRICSFFSAKIQKRNNIRNLIFVLLPFFFLHNCFTSFCPFPPPHDVAIVLLPVTSLTCNCIIRSWNCTESHSV